MLYSDIYPWTLSLTCNWHLTAKTWQARANKPYPLFVILRMDILYHNFFSGEKEMPDL